jgi:nucleotide-binding universal stress UspA family protein
MAFSVMTYASRAAGAGHLPSSAGRLCHALSHTGIRRKRSVTPKESKMSSSSSTRSGIVVGVDGSPESDTAVRWAARDAVMRKTSLTVVHAQQPAMFWPQTSIPVGIDAWREDESKRIVTDSIKIAKESIADDGPSQIESKFFVSAPVPTLVDLSEHAEMVVVGCRGRDALKHGVVGSVSTALVHHAHCPVAVVRGERSSVSQSAAAPVVVGVDGSPASDLATAIAFEEASWRGVGLVAMHAWSDGGVAEFLGDLWPDIQQSVDEVLADRLAPWSARFPDVSVRRVAVLDRPGHHLVELSESSQLVVVGSHGRGGFTRALLGSVSSAVTHGAYAPVIVARQR